VAIGVLVSQRVVVTYVFFFFVSPVRHVTNMDLSANQSSSQHEQEEDQEVDHTTSVNAPLASVQSKSKPKSVRDYFIIGPTGQKCKIGGCKIGLKTSTTVMRNHLFKRHNVSPSTFEPVPVVPESNPIMHKFMTHGTTVKQALQQEEIELLITEFLADNNLAAAVLNKPSTRRLLDLIPHFKPFSSEVFKSRVLPLHAGKVREHIKDKLRQARAISISSDEWTSRSNRCFITLVARAVFNDFSVDSFVLGTLIFDVKRTTKNIHDKLASILENFDCLQKVASITSDNASNMKSLGEASSWRWVGCVCHTIQLAVKDVLKSNHAVDAVLKKAKIIIKKARKSAKLSLAICQFQMVSDVEQPLSLIQDVSTRWNSTFLSMSRLLTLQNHVRNALTSCGLETLMLSREELETLDHICVILRSCYDATTYFSAATISISEVVPYFHDMIEDLGQQSPSFPRWASDMKQMLKEKIELRFAPYFHPTSPTVLASFLDPRFKPLTFLKNQSDRDLVHKHISSLIDALLEQPVKSPEVVIVDNLDLPKFLRTAILQSEAITSSSSLKCIEDYLHSPMVGPLQNPLQYWSVHERTFGQLGQVAADYLVTQPTSVDCERVFSAAGLVYSPLRNRLNHAKLDDLLMIRINSSRMKKDRDETQASRRYTTNTSHLNSQVKRKKMISHSSQQQRIPTGSLRPSSRHDDDDPDATDTDEELGISRQQLELDEFREQAT
jgi:hypothetical protein